MSLLKQKAQQIQLILLDADNILTDGQIIWSSQGKETKNFHVLDGFGIKRMQTAGFKVGVLSARASEVTEYRAKELEMDIISIGSKEKRKALDKMLSDLKLEYQHVAYMGDDLLDLPVLQVCGFSATVPEAVFEVKRMVDYVTQCSAGKGAIREWLDLLLHLSNKAK